MKTTFLIACVLTSSLAHSASLSCHQDRRTDAMQCIDTADVRQRDGIRSTALYTGGPAGVSRTSFTVHVNCQTHMAHLKDRQGVSFAGGYADSTLALRELYGMICDAKPKNKAQNIAPKK